MDGYRLGFLLCDHALDPFEARFGDYPVLFERAFSEVTDAIEWQVYDATRGELPDDADACDGYLISGSRHGAYDPLSWIEPLEQFVLQVAASQRPLVGLCFGHQIIGHALGAEVEKSELGWGIGIHEYEVVETQEWMQPELPRFVVPVCHQDQVLSLPPIAKRLVRSDHCENFVVRFTDNILGIQGHPEFETEFIEQLIEWRRTRLPGTVYEAARRSLARAHDNALLKRWITRFLGIPARSI